MFDTNKLKEKFRWPVFRLHLCTLAVCMSHNSLWRAPREAFYYGGLPYALLLTAVTALVALPAALIQLAVGQLSQQDTVGVWRAVPFFQGIGYIRLLISATASVYTMVYMGLSTVYFLYTINNSIPFEECIIDQVENNGNITYIIYNAGQCLNDTFLAPFSEKPEYFFAMAFVILAFWIMLPFGLYKHVNMLKKHFYVLGPSILIVCIIICCCIGRSSNISTIHNWSHWNNLLTPYIWQSVVAQALCSSQIAGGYLIVAADTIYSNANVQWTSLIFVGANLFSNWCGILFWYAIGGVDTKDEGPAAVAMQIYEATVHYNHNKTWPLLVYAVLFFSGVLTMFILVYPLYDRFYRVGGDKWRLVCFGYSLVGACASVAVLFGRLPALSMLDDYVVPLFVSVSTVIEVAAFVFIYGWKILLEDIEFLTGTKLSKYWVYGWHISPIITAMFTTWWVVMVIMQPEWVTAPWPDSAVVTTAALLLVVVIACAATAVIKQVQYDFISKLKSAFLPSRHWGPRDPIAHYYWLARREENERGNLPRTMRYQTRHFGQLSVIPSYSDLPDTGLFAQDFTLPPDSKTRTNSDDWLYTGHRRRYLEDMYKEYFLECRNRSFSLDMANKAVTKKKGLFKKKSPSSSSVSSKEQISHIVTIHEERIK